MTPAQIRSIRASFTRMNHDLSALAAEFYEGLSSAVPELSALLGGHRTALEETFVKAIGELMQQRSSIALPALGGGTAAMPAMAELGRRHIAIGVRPEHFPVLRMLLMRLLREAMGADFTDGVQEAWGAVFDVLAKAMLDGLGNLPNTEASFFHRLGGEDAGADGAPAPSGSDSAALHQFFR